MSPAFADELAERQAIADLSRGAELKLANGVAVALSPNRRHEFYAFENADVRGVVDLLGSGGWILEVVLLATFLATHSLADALAVAELVAEGFGEVLQARLRRFDLAADFVGWPLRRDDAERLSTRAGKSSFIVDSKDFDEVETQLVKPAVREFARNGVGVTGFAIGSGNDLSARIYAKSFELNLPGREAKREIEHALWRARGWKGQDVTRVEFQHRGPFLDETKLRDPYDLESKLDEIWAYDTQKFLRMKELGTASRLERCAEDPRWIATRAAFRHDVSPIPRTRAIRGGANAALVVGATLSHAAASGKLERLSVGQRPTSRDDIDAALDDALENVHLRARLVHELVRRTEPANRRAAEELADRLLLKHGGKALTVLAERVNGLIARFSSVDDQTASLTLNDQTSEGPAKGSSGP